MKTIWGFAFALLLAFAVLNGAARLAVHEGHRRAALPGGGAYVTIAKLDKTMPSGVRFAKASDGVFYRIEDKGLIDCLATGRPAKVWWDAGGPHGPQMHWEAGD